MGDRLITALSTIAAGIIGLAVVAVLVSRNANTSQVVGAGGSAFSGALEAAEAPVLGGGLNVAGTYINNEL